MILLKLIVMAILFIPAFVLTIAIWIMGGWTKGFDYMPNPIYALIEWVDS